MNTLEVIEKLRDDCQEHSALESFSECESRALLLSFSKGVFGLGQAYERGEWDVPKLDSFMFKLFNLERSKWSILRPAVLKLIVKDILLNLQTYKRAFTVAKEHYDLGNDLFKAMLDQSMTYTCGYWKEVQDLNQAQEAKLKLCCDKLQLKPGMRVLDIGCGWGNFAEYAARNYCVAVTGLTISKEQAAFARNRCKDLNVEILLKDYREIHSKFDRVVSIEMIEAVGRKNLNCFFDVAARNLSSNGLFLLQAISADSFSRTSSVPFDEFLVWLIKYIFPNGYLPKIKELTSVSRNGLKIEHMEQFGADYDRTLLAWQTNFESSWDDLKEKYSESFRRRWNFYLLSCAALFRARKVDLYQVLYSKT